MRLRQNHSRWLNTPVEAPMAATTARRGCRQFDATRCDRCDAASRPSRCCWCLLLYNAPAGPVGWSADWARSCLRYMARVLSLAPSSSSISITTGSSTDRSHSLPVGALGPRCFTFTVVVVGAGLRGRSTTSTMSVAQRNRLWHSGDYCVSEIAPDGDRSTRSSYARNKCLPPSARYYSNRLCCAITASFMTHIPVFYGYLRRQRSV